MVLAALNPNDVHFGEEGGYNTLMPEALIGVISWIAVLMAAYSLARWWRLPHRQSLWLWGVCNAVPLVWLVAVSPLDFLTFSGAAMLLGLMVAGAFSWAIGRSVFDARERERREVERFIAAGDIDPQHIKRLVREGEIEPLESWKHKSR